jgi:hypothetical protein
VFLASYFGDVKGFLLDLGRYDAMVGAYIGAIESLGLTDNTWFITTSDHGGCMPGLFFCACTLFFLQCVPDTLAAFVSINKHPLLALWDASWLLDFPVFATLASCCLYLQRWQVVACICNVGKLFPCLCIVGKLLPAMVVMRTGMQSKDARLHGKRLQHGDGKASFGSDAARLLLHPRRQRFAVRKRVN